MDISVIIVNWNTRDMLIDCLRSLEAQKGNFQKEVIVVDNGSSDGSQAAIRTAFPEVQVIENEVNLGFAKANNIGIMKSCGRYVCLVNSDVMVMDNCLQRLITFMDSNLSIGISGPKILNPDLTTQDSCRSFPTLWNNLSPALGLDKIFKNVIFFSGEHMFHFKHDVVLPVDYLAGCFFMVRRKALNEVGLFDERFFIYQEEVDWCKRFKGAGWNVVFFPEVSAIHHHGASSSKDPKRFALARQKSFLQYWEKHYNPLSVMAIRSVLLLHHVLRIIIRAVLYLVHGSQRNSIIQKIKIDLAYISALLRKKMPSHMHDHT